MSPPQARRVVHDYSDWCLVNTDPLLIISTSQLSEQHSINFWDALIVEAALCVGADELVTEDLQNGRRFGKLWNHTAHAWALDPDKGAAWVGSARHQPGRGPQLHLRPHPRAPAPKGCGGAG